MQLTGTNGELIDDKPSSLPLGRDFMAFIAGILMCCSDTKDLNSITVIAY
jgi:hypothetical protein